MSSGGTVACGRVQETLISARPDSGVPNAPAGASDEVTWRQTHSTANKVDILFVVDNSANMAPKQAFMAQAALDLLARPTHPLCRRQRRGHGSE